MQVIGYILIIFAVADFGLSWLGYNLTPFLPVAISKFSPIIIGAIGYFFLNAQNMGSGSDDPALDIYKRCGWEPPKYFSEEKELEARREFISQNVSTEALKALDKVCEEYVSKFLTSKI